MNASSKKNDVKKISGYTTLGVGVFSVAVLLLTGWFIVKSLNDVAVAKTGDGGKTAKIQGVNNQLLEKVQKFLTDKSASDRRLGTDLRNSFAKPAPPPVAPAPEPVSPPAAAPPAAPAPAAPPAQ